VLVGAVAAVLHYQPSNMWPTKCERIRAGSNVADIARARNRRSERTRNRRAS